MRRRYPNAAARAANGAAAGVRHTGGPGICNGGPGICNGGPASSAASGVAGGRSTNGPAAATIGVSPSVLPLFGASDSEGCNNSGHKLRNMYKNNSSSNDGMSDVRASLKRERPLDEDVGQPMDGDARGGRDEDDGGRQACFAEAGEGGGAPWSAASEAEGAAGGVIPPRSPPSAVTEVSIAEPPPMDSPSASPTLVHTWSFPPHPAVHAKVASSCGLLSPRIKKGHFATEVATQQPSSLSAPCPAKGGGQRRHHPND